ncbi:acyl-CoA dehydrogenase [Aeromicrobium sp. Leaf350]|uniref:acyl-CoA dehydrogenase n=1 Tax=Aeromicrobium sp. Leaf350 TaxID=2876565 RepID=UPI001E4A11E2|nr:acyl-CoA dehydrogenase [Aeromicrobium sp. Leaf350]
MTSSPRRTLRPEDLRPHTASPWPIPGAGDTATRWSSLADLAARDLPLVKVVEPHHDAAAILADLGGRPPQDDEIWGVWAAEPPFAVLTASRDGDRWTLSGTKAFCSGASLVTHALVTARTDAGSRLFAVELTDGVRADDTAPRWSGAGMARADTTALAFDAVAATPVGDVGDYVDRPGFWLGAIGIAACWLGGATGVAATLEKVAPRLDPHGLAHLGAVRAALDTAQLAMTAAADLADREDLTTERSERLAHALRAHAAGTVETVVSHVGRALGPGPLAFDAAHAEHVQDLQVFVRQHHAERDLERLGSLGAPDA